MQKELFNQAKNDHERYYEDDGHLYGDYEDYQHHGHYESEEERKSNERFLFHLIEEEGEDRNISQDLMDDVVTFILSQPDYSLVRFL